MGLGDENIWVVLLAIAVKLFVANVKGLFVINKFL
jgi:hypothetical protein